MDDKYAIQINNTVPYVYHSSRHISNTDVCYTVYKNLESVMPKDGAEEDILNHLECILREYRPNIFIDDMQNF